MSKHRVVIVGVSQQLRGQAGGPCLALDQVREADLLKIFETFFSSSLVARQVFVVPGKLYKCSPLEVGSWPCLQMLDRAGKAFQGHTLKLISPLRK